VNSQQDIIKEVVAIIPAAGVGRRMGMDYPKQYLKIGSQTILEHSISCLLAHPDIEKLIIVTRHDDPYFKTLPIADNPKVLQAYGGLSRAESVLAGLSEVHRNCWVLVHDAVRPCLHFDDLSKVLEMRQFNSFGSILALPVYDTIKYVNSNEMKTSYTIERDNLWHALTPQIFPKDLLITCLMKAIDAGATITDEASALEYCGYSPSLIRGRNDNIKLTHYDDLGFVDFFLTRIRNKDKK
jgi:2-C-methyl-D-erythritol 4-phosphate cytidylyltransferase